MCERINDDKVSLVECKDHDFNHALKCMVFHDQLKQTLLNIQILAENNGKNHRGRFQLLHFSTWMWVPIKILQDFQMSKKCCPIVYLQPILRINNLCNIHDYLLKKLCIQFFLLGLTMQSQPSNTKKKTINKKHGGKSSMSKFFKLHN